MTESLATSSKISGKEIQPRVQETSFEPRRPSLYRRPERSGDAFTVSNPFANFNFGRAPARQQSSLSCVPPGPSSFLVMDEEPIQRRRGPLFPAIFKKEAFWLAFGASAGVAAAAASVDTAAIAIFLNDNLVSAAGGGLAVFGVAACLVSTWAASADIGQVTGSKMQGAYLFAALASVLSVCVGNGLHVWSTFAGGDLVNMTCLIPVLIGTGILSVVVPEVFACTELVRGAVLPPSGNREQIRRIVIAAALGTLNAWATVDGTAKYPRAVRTPILALATTSLFLAEGITRADHLRRLRMLGDQWREETNINHKTSLVPVTTGICAVGGKLVTAMSAAALVSSLRHNQKTIEVFSALGIVVGMAAAIYAALRFAGDVAKAGRPDAALLKTASLSAAFTIAAATVAHQYLFEVGNKAGERAVILPLLLAISTVSYVLPEFFARSEDVRGLIPVRLQNRERARRTMIAVGIAVNATWAHLAHDLRYPRPLTPPILALATTILLLGEAFGRSEAVAYERAIGGRVASHPEIELESHA